ncbi:MAG: T9SS type A sorting domain-containing protein [Chitinophagaceae bacterium]
MMMKDIFSKTGLLTVILMLILGTVQNSEAQTWQWGKRGGGQFDGNNSSPHEAVKSMATDKNGNVYTLSVIEASGTPDVDGHSLTAYGGKDVLLASFTCNGTYRWSKVFGGSRDDYPKTIGTDTIGHVYVTMQQGYGTNVNFSSDTFQIYTSKKLISLLQYDTSGNFKWLRQPQPDTATPNTNNLQISYDTYVAANGDIYWFTKLTAGLVGGENWVVPIIQPYILKYNSQGTMTGHTPIDMQIGDRGFLALNFTKSKSGKYIIAGTQDKYSGVDSLKIAGNNVSHATFLACFSSQGNLLWKKENAFFTYTNRMWCRPQVDQQGNIYYAGDAAQGDVFNGFTFTNSYPTTFQSSLPYVGKCDSNGALLWTIGAGGNAANYQNSLSLKGANEVWLSGANNSSHWDSTHFIQSPTNTGTRVYAARFNSSGKILSLDTVLGTSGNLNYAYCNAVDPKGNLYIGGEFSNDLNVGPDHLINSGGASDFFIAKFGYPCYCTTQPTASFNSVATGKTLKFTYTGTTTNIDSVVWSWGDGQQQTVKSGYTTPLSHTYTGGGSYTTCANVYGSCGSSSYCKQTALGVSGISAFNGVSIYPNPAVNYFTVEGASGATITLSNAVGQVVKSFSLTTDKEVLDISELAAGVYVLQLRDKEGNRGVMQLVKQ